MCLKKDANTAKKWFAKHKFAIGWSMSIVSLRLVVRKDTFRGGHILIFLGSYEPNMQAKKKVIKTLEINIKVARYLVP